MVGLACDRNPHPQPARVPGVPPHREGCRQRATSAQNPIKNDIYLYLVRRFANAEISLIRQLLLKRRGAGPGNHEPVRLASAAKCPDAALFSGLVATLILRPT